MTVQGSKAAEFKDQGSEAAEFKVQGSK